MSIEAAQARIAEISARFGTAAVAAPVRLTAATTGTALAGSPTGGTSAAPSADTFQQQLDAVLSGSRAGGVPGTDASASDPAVDPVAAAASGGVAPPVKSVAEAVIDSAKKHLGVPYLWGGTTPAGFDCSGLLQYVYRQHGVDLPRVSKDQARAGVAVSPADARPGDIVAFDNSSSRAGIDHIGMYIGGGKWIAAPRTGDVVKIQDVDLSRAVAIRRVLPTESTVQAATAAGPLSSGRLSSGGDWTGKLPAAAQQHIGALSAAGAATGVDPRLLAAVAWTESGFSATARSHAGAQGLMQLMPGTARALGVNALDPKQAALGGAKYLRDQLKDNGGRVDLALAAYNAGPVAVKKYGGIPPYQETQRYVAKVMERFVELGGRV